MPAAHWMMQKFAELLQATWAEAGEPGPMGLSPQYHPNLQESEPLVVLYNACHLQTRHRSKKTRLTPEPGEEASDPSVSLRTLS